MSPINASPKRGYADWGRVNDWDTGILFTGNAAPGVTSDSSPPLDMSRFATCALFLAAITNNVRVELSWSADQGNTFATGSRTFVISPNHPDSSNLFIPNLGPWLLFQALEIGANPFQYVARVFATNRQPPIESYPFLPHLIDIQGQTLALNTSTAFYPTNLFSGPAKLWYTNAAAGGLISLQTLTINGTWDTIDQIGTSTTGELYLVCPAGSWRILVNTPAGTPFTSFFLGVTPSLTGGT